MSESWKRNLPVPFFSQRENKYQWQRIDTVGNKIGLSVSLAWQSCNITSLCMILHYFGITNDTPYEMTRKFFEISDFTNHDLPAKPKFTHDLRHEANGYDKLGYGRFLKEFVEKAYNIPEQYITHTSRSMLLADIKKKIASGYPVWISFGPLQTDSGIWGQGHIAVVRGFAQNGDIILNDPWGDPASAAGELKSTGEIRGVYDFSTGCGDNAVMKSSSFNEIIYTDGLHQSLVIEYPHIWSFPIRDNGNTGTPLLFSSHKNYGKSNEEKKVYRSMQIAEMQKVEAIDKACYPVTDLGRWHDGIHIDKVGGTPIYSVGPGQLIAVKAAESAKRPDGTSTCFALVKHKFNLTNKGTEFYSLLMSIAPTDIAERFQL